MTPFLSLPLTEQPAEIKSALEAHFGDDANYGITIGAGDMEDAHLFPDGTDSIICSNYAVQVFREMQGRFPVKIIGFSIEENPHSAIAQMAGGHDFVLLGDRYIVDGWIKNVEGLTAEAVFDLESEEDRSTISHFYGPADCFLQNEELELYALRAKTNQDEATMKNIEMPLNPTKEITRKSAMQADSDMPDAPLAYFKTRYPERIWSSETVEYDGGQYSALSFVDAKSDTNIFDPLSTWDDDGSQDDRYGLTAEDAAEMRKLNIPHRLSSTTHVDLDDVLADIRRLLIQRPDQQSLGDALASYDFMPKTTSGFGKTYDLSDPRSGETMRIATANGDLPASWHDEIEVLINDKAGLLNFKWTNDSTQKRRPAPR